MKDNLVILGLEECIDESANSLLLNLTEAFYKVLLFNTSYIQVTSYHHRIFKSTIKRAPKDIIVGFATNIAISKLLSQSDRMKSRSRKEVLTFTRQIMFPW